MGQSRKPVDALILRDGPGKTREAVPVKAEVVSDDLTNRLEQIASLLMRASTQYTAEQLLAGRRVHIAFVTETETRCEDAIVPEAHEVVLNANDEYGRLVRSGFDSEQALPRICKQKAIDTIADMMLSRRCPPAYSPSWR